MDFCKLHLDLSIIYPTTVVKSSEVVHASNYASLEGIGELLYLHILVDDNQNQDAVEKCYIGLQSEVCEQFCYTILENQCSGRLLEQSQTSVPLIGSRGPSGGISSSAQSLPVPERLLRDESKILGKCIAELGVILHALPGRFSDCCWKLVYSTDRHGISMNTFYLNNQIWPASLIFVEDTNGNIFGGFASSTWKPSETYYGTYDCFLFQLFPVPSVYVSIPGSNSFFMLSKHDHIEMGGG
jgi:hypothetical protein